MTVTSLVDRTTMSCAMAVLCDRCLELFGGLVTSVRLLETDRMPNCSTLCR